MNARARKALLKAHGEKLAASSTSEKEGESVPYGKRIHLQGRKMAMAIWEGKDYLPFVVKK